MKAVRIFPIAMALGSALSLGHNLAQAAEIRVMCYQDGSECDTMADLAKRFEAQNPATKIVLDMVPYKAIVEQLPVQLAAGQGPDIARVTDLGGLSKFYMDIAPYVKDRKYWENQYGSTLAWLRPNDKDTGIYGLQSQLTVTGPFVNKTLFEQAKIPMPGPKATWDDWVDASRKVAKATQTKAAMVWDRSGHRFAGPAISYGAKLFDAKGNLQTDAGYKTTVKKFIDWNKDGSMLREVWVSAGGSSYADAGGEFVNGNVVMMLSGSWQITRLQRDIGNKFDWVAVPNPCGPAACTGIPGGAAWVALKTSKSPKEVGAFLDFMASEAVYREFSARTFNIPAHAGIAKKGVDYAGAQAAQKAALNVFSAGVSDLSPQAYKFQGYKFNRALMFPTVARVTQGLVGELSLDDVMTKIDADMKDAVAQAQK